MSNRAKEVRNSQLKVQLEHGVHTALGMTQREFRDHFPEPVEQPNGFSSLYDYPIYVMTGLYNLSLHAQMDLIKGRNYIPTCVDRWGRKHPHSPYVAWTNGGTSTRGLPVTSVRESLLKDVEGTRGGNTVEGMLLVMVYGDEDKIRGFGLDLPGSSVAGEGVPALSFLMGSPTLNNHVSHERDARFGSLVVGNNRQFPHAK